MKDGIVGNAVGVSEVRPFWRLVFWSAAAMNFAIGLAAMLAPGMDNDARIVGLLVLCFGIVYALVARDSRRYGPTLWAGLIGKVGVVALLAPTHFGPGGHPVMMVVLLLDIAFAVAFLTYLLTAHDPG